MADNAIPSNDPHQPTLDIDDAAQLATWSKKFDCTPEQLKEAVAAAGNRESDIEMHLKGSHSTSNSDRVHAALQNKP
jgi:hypothetical protein